MAESNQAQLNTHEHEYQYQPHHEDQDHRHEAASQIEAEKKSWNNFAEYYGETLEKGSLSAGITLGRMVKLELAKTIVEAGCSTGILSLYWLNILPPGTKYISIDISEEMIKLAQQRKDKLGKQFNHIEHSFIQADAHNLSFIPDETVDVYISCLMLCHVPDPKKALQEAVRILKKGGRIGISLGNMGKNTLSEFVKAAKAKSNVPPSQHSHVTPLKDKEALIKAAQEAGIEVEYVWDQDLPFELFEDEDILKGVQVRGDLCGVSKEIQETFIKEVREGFRENKKKFIPFKFNLTFLVGKKAE